ncbi:MAG: hypothetical protein NUV69_03185 [Candidatus Curtissbacteria bacterium]|nr:hypothetical protein [Candidatus Curtissbacteria bacterium]
MKDQEAGPSQPQEILLAPEDQADIARIVSWVNTNLRRHYPDAPELSVDQVKVVPDLNDTETAINLASLHPFFLEKIKGKVVVGAPPGARSWVDRDSNSIYFDYRVVEDLRKNKVAGYFGIGMDSIDATVLLGTEIVNVESETATKLAVDSTTASYRQTLTGIVTETDLEAAIQYIKEKGCKIRIIGLQTTIM